MNFREINNILNKISEIAKNSGKKINYTLFIEADANGEEYYSLEIYGDADYREDFDTLTELYKRVRGIAIGLAMGLGQEV